MSQPKAPYGTEQLGEEALSAKEPPALRNRKVEWLWVAILAFAILGAAAVLIVGLYQGSFGWALVFGIPIALGFVFGFALKPRKHAAFLGFLSLIAIVGSIATLGLSGLVCGLVFLVIAAVPTLVGILLGRLLAYRLGRNLSFGLLLPWLLFPTLGGLVLAEARWTPAFEIESIETRRVLAHPADQAWKSLVFYEDVPLRPPLLARLGVPHPIRTAGHVAGPGDVRLCRYSSGHLRKRITAYQPGRLLAFDVIEQVGVEDHSAELISGSFRFEPLPNGWTEVVLTTTYRPLLQARWAWRPFERAVAHVLHEHVLDGMELTNSMEPVQIASPTP